jgi:hypothetical protein
MWVYFKALGSTTPEKVYSLLEAVHSDGIHLNLQTTLLGRRHLDSTLCFTYHLPSLGWLFKLVAALHQSRVLALNSFL